MSIAKSTEPYDEKQTFLLESKNASQVGARNAHDKRRFKNFDKILNINETSPRLLSKNIIDSDYIIQSNDVCTLTIEQLDKKIRNNTSFLTLEKRYQITKIH